MDATRVITQFVQRVRQSGSDEFQIGAELAKLGRHRRVRHAQLQHQRDQPLLGAVVQVTLDPLASLVRSGDEPRPRFYELGLRFGVGDRGRDEFGEIGDAALGSGRKRAAFGDPVTATPHRRPSTTMGPPAPVIIPASRKSARPSPVARRSARPFPPRPFAAPSRRGIARQIWISGAMVEKHVHSLLGKLDLPDSTDDHRRVLAVLAYLSSAGS